MPITSQKGRGFRLTKLASKAMPYLLLCPAFLLIGVILIYPSIYNFYLSLWDWKYIKPEAARFIGLGNYIEIFKKDNIFWQALKNTGIFTISAVSLEFVLGLGTALLLAQRSFKTRRVLGPVLILPYMIAASVAGLIWRLLWIYEYGLVNYLLGLFGIERIRWLSEPGNAMVAVVTTEVWKNTPFVTLVLLAGLMALPPEPYEAARVDGASSWQAFRYITLPLLIPPITIALLFRTIFALRVFDVVFTLTRGGPGTATLPLGILIYTTTFRYFRGGYSAALAMVMLVIGVMVSSLYLRLIYRRVEF